MKKYLTEVVLLTKSYNLQDFKDWLHWHLDIIGFDHCHVFDNESSVDIKTVCDAYGEKVSYELIKGWPNQYELYNRYINSQSPAWWVLTIDDDEFIWMKNFDNVNKMILHYQDKWKDMNKLSIRWQNMFPKDPKAERGNKSLMEFNTEANERWANLLCGGNKPVKTFVKTTNIVRFSITERNQTHNPITDGSKSYLCNGERLFGNWYYGKPTDTDIKILHYQYKSAKEWEHKCKTRKDPTKQKNFCEKNSYYYNKNNLNVLSEMLK